MVVNKLNGDITPIEECLIIGSGDDCSFFKKKSPGILSPVHHVIVLGKYSFDDDSHPAVRYKMLQMAKESGKPLSSGWSLMAGYLK